MRFLNAFTDYIPITRRELCNARESKERANAVINYFFLKSRLQKSRSEDYCNKVKSSLRRLTYSINEKWMKANRNKKAFEIANEIWLDGFFCIPSENSFKIPEELMVEPSTSNFGRPRVEFSNKSEKGKRLEVSALVNECSPEQLTFAAGVSLYKSGKRDASAILRNVNESPTRAAKIKKF